MQKHILYILIMVSMPLHAAVRSASDAKNCAETFFAQPPQSAAIRRTIKPQPIHLAATYVCQDSETPAFYAFNRGEADGFVLITANDALPTVLGYADNGTFDQSAMPDNMRDWLENYQHELSWAADHPDTYMARQTPSASDMIEPLLGSIKWNQSAPFNLQCPIYTGTTHATVGCVATATAQVMKYYQHPQKGTGSHSYTSTTQKFNLSASFDTTYQWSDMLDKYETGKYTTTQANAVALLLSHVGIASDMNYASGGSSSSAHLHNAGYALKTYFGYDKSLQIQCRDFYSGDWEKMILTELRAKRPVIYTGFTPSGGGHCFVCDGYNADGYFHFNWGWSGSDDGYFLLTALYPKQKVVGSTEGGYSFSQQALIGVKPDEGGTAPEIAHCTYKDLTVGATSYDRNAQIKFQAKYLQNNSVDSIMTGNLAILIMQNNQIKLRINLSQASSAFSPATFYSTLTFSGYAKSTSLPNGTYDVTLGYWENGYQLWRLVNGRGGTPYYFTLEATSSKLTFTPRVKNSCVVELKDVLGDSIAAVAGTLSPVLWLPSKYHNYRDSMHLVLRNTATQKIAYSSPSYYVDHTAGTYDTTVISLSKTPAVGTYRAYIYYGDQVLDSLDRTLTFYTLKELCTPHDIQVTCVDSFATLTWKSVCDSFIVQIMYPGSSSFKNHLTHRKKSLPLTGLLPGEYTYLILAYYKAAGSTKYTRYSTSSLTWQQPEYPLPPTPTDLEAASKDSKVRKFMQDGQLYLLYEDKKLHVLGL